jgi:hypothetical protein
LPLDRGGLARSSTDSVHNSGELLKRPSQRASTPGAPTERERPSNAKRASRALPRRDRLRSRWQSGQGRRGGPYYPVALNLGSSQSEFRLLFGDGLREAIRPQTTGARRQE